MDILALEEAERIIYSSSGVFVFDLALLPSEFVTEKRKLTLQRSVCSHHTNHWSHFTCTVGMQLRK